MDAHESKRDTLMVERRPPTVMFGIPIDDVTMAECLDEIDDLVVDGRANRRTHQVATVNVDFLVNAALHEDVKVLLQNTSLNVPDGMPIVWGAPLVGSSLSERVAGADLVPLLAAESARRGWHVYLFGGAGDVAHRAQELLTERHPDANVTADTGPAIVDVNDIDDDVLDRIRDADPDILCVALGNPKQERFIAAHRERLGTPVMIGIGGSMDMLVGDKRRAPRWVQTIGAEWVVRAAQEPTRLGRRYLSDARTFVPLLARAARTTRHYSGGPQIELSRGTGDSLEVAIASGDRRAGSPVDATVWRRDSYRSVHIDLGDARALDPVDHAVLVGVIRSAARQGVKVQVEPVSEDLQRYLDELGTLAYFAGNSGLPTDNHQQSLEGER